MKVVRGELGVDRGGGHGLMAHELLNGLEARAVHGEVGGENVAQRRSWNR